MSSGANAQTPDTENNNNDNRHVATTIERLASFRCTELNYNIIEESSNDNQSPLLPAATRKRTMKFLLHCQDGAPPFLTPYLLQTYFPSESNPHLALGIDMSDSCVVPVFNEHHLSNDRTDTGIITLSKRQQKKSKRRQDNGQESNNQMAPKPSGYTFAGRPIDTYLMIPNIYDTIVVPTWDLVDSFNATKTSAKVPFSNTKITLCTDNGRQTIDPTIFVNVLHGLKTATSCVLLYDDAGNDIETTKRKACTVERTCHFVDQILLLTVQAETQQKVKYWIPTIGGDNIELRKNSVKEAVNRYHSTKRPDLIQGIALIGLHRCRLRELLESCLQEIPMNVAVTVPVTIDWMQILDCMRSGVDVIGSSLPLTLANDHKALVLDLHGWKGKHDEHHHKDKKVRYCDNSDNDRKFDDAAAVMDIKDPKHEFDTSPLVSDCQCFACRNHIRAYIHHLSNVKELLGEILLFVHNLHHLLEWFKEFSNAINVGKEDVFIQHIQSQLLLNNK